MKYILTYTHLKSLISQKMEALIEGNYDEVLAISRGGVTAAHIIAKQLRLPMGYIFPKSEYFPKARLILANPNSKRVLVVDDLVALGRTYEEVSRLMTIVPNLAWDYMPIVTDANYEKRFPLSPLVTSDWVVFPYEDASKTVENDHGLFRLNSDKYGKDEKHE